jgi:group II intron reverse transcriptase/maturase
MTRQNNENPAVPKGRRKATGTGIVESIRGGKGVPIEQQVSQLELWSGTAENPEGKPKGATGETGRPQRRFATHVAPKPNHKDRKAIPATMEEVASHLPEAFQKVAANRGAPGPDRRSIDEVRERLEELLPRLAETLRKGDYRPGEIRRVWIPKSGGGKRGLGIPNVIDRMVQEAVRQVLEPLYEPTFHRSSHGFRPDRSCHTAITEARRHVEEGYEWVVDLDLEKFFDQVSHQRLMARLAEKIQDRRLLVLIGRMLKAKVVMPDGVVVRTEEGVPQGGPLSPLLSNVVLDEFDCELARRGHRFVRYADDTNVYVRSERAGKRVMVSLTRYLTGRLRLKVNEEKSAVARPEERHFVGFSLKKVEPDGKVEVLLSKRSKDRIDTKIRELTPRNWGNSLRSCIHQMNEYLLGWIGFFGICTAGSERTFAGLDAHIRRRLRAIQLKHWRRKRAIAKHLIQLGAHRKTAWRNVYQGRKSLWSLSHDPVVDRALRNAYFAERGLVSLRTEWRQRTQSIVAPTQGVLWPASG